MYLIPRIYCEVKIRNHGEPADEKIHEKSEEAITGNDNDYLPLESMLSGRLKLMLQKHRAENEEAERLAKVKVKEARQKREWEETQAQFDADLETLFNHAKKQKKKCTVLYFKETAALLHTTVLQAKGLGSRTPAGRKCQCIKLVKLQQCQLSIVNCKRAIVTVKAMKR